MSTYPKKRWSWMNICGGKSLRGSPSSNCSDSEASASHGTLSSPLRLSSEINTPSCVRTPKKMDFDEDLWPEILKRLPVDSLLRFRSVCKSWNSLISSPAFIRAQYLFSSSDSIESKTYLLFNTEAFLSYPAVTVYALYNPYQFNPSESQHRIGFQVVPFELLQCVVSVIHGVVCLSYLNPDGFDDGHITGYTILWNPAIRKFVQIPRPDRAIDVGFGFDARNDDFKLVRLVPPSMTTLEVYSYREGRSRTLDSEHIGPISIFNPGRYNCFKNGAIHWILQRPNYSGFSILRFDCESEELKEMELPQLFKDLDFETRRLYVIFGKVLLLGADEAETGVWEIDEYDGVDTSWRKAAYHKDLVWITHQDGIMKLEDDEFSTWRGRRRGSRDHSRYGMDMFSSQACF